MSDPLEQDATTPSTEELLRAGLAQLKQGLEQLLETPADPPAPAPAAEQPSASGSTIVSELLGFTPDELRAQPALAEEALNRFFGGVHAWLRNVSADDAEGLAAARRQLAELRETLARQGIGLPAALEDLPQRLRETQVAEQAAQENGLADSLEALAAALQRAAAEAGSVLQEKAGDLRGGGETESDSQL